MTRTGLTTKDRRRGVTPVAAAPARRVRARQPARSRRHRLVRGLVLLVVLTGAAAWVLLASPLLAVQQIDVDGARTLTADEVRAAAGITEGTALARVDVEAAAAAVARLPQVASVEVVRGWPHSVVVTLVERVPVAVVGTAGVRSLVDAEGTLFETVTGATPPGVVPMDVPTPGPGDRATTAGLAVLASLPPTVLATVTQLTATTGDDVTLQLTGGHTVLWGSDQDADRKARVLDALLQQIAAGTLDDAGTIDVSVPDAVILR